MEVRRFGGDKSAQPCDTNCHLDPVTAKVTLVLVPTPRLMVFAIWEIGVAIILARLSSAGHVLWTLG